MIVVITVTVATAHIDDRVTRLTNVPPLDQEAPKTEWPEGRPDPHQHEPDGWGSDTLLRGRERRSTTKPKATNARPVRSQARKVRSLARWSLRFAFISRILRYAPYERSPFLMSAGDIRCRHSHGGTGS